MLLLTASGKALCQTRLDMEEIYHQGQSTTWSDSAVNAKGVCCSSCVSVVCCIHSPTCLLFSVSTVYCSKPARSKFTAVVGLLPSCSMTYPNIRSTHSCRCSDTMSLSSASRCNLMNSSGLPLAQGGSATSPTATPVCKSAESDLLLQESQ